MSRQRHRDANLAARAEPGRTWTILTPARASTGPGELSVLVSGGCPSVPRWFHPHVKSCARQEEAQSETGQNSEQRLANKWAEQGSAREGGAGRTRPSSQMARELRLPATTAVTL